jgi:hypothetical protein
MTTLSGCRLRSCGALGQLVGVIEVDDAVGGTDGEQALAARERPRVLRAPVVEARQQTARHAQVPRVDVAAVAARVEVQHVVAETTQDAFSFILTAPPNCLLCYCARSTLPS